MRLKNVLKTAVVFSTLSASPFLFGAQPERPGFWGEEYEAPELSTEEWNTVGVEWFSANPGGDFFELEGVNFRFSQNSKLDEKSGLSSELSLNAGIGCDDWSELEKVRIPINVEIGVRKDFGHGFSVYGGIFGGADIVFWDMSDYVPIKIGDGWTDDDFYLGIGLQVGMRVEAQYQFDEHNAVTLGFGVDRNIKRIGTESLINDLTEDASFRIISIGYRHLF